MMKFKKLIDRCGDTPNDYTKSLLKLYKHLETDESIVINESYEFPLTDSLCKKIKQSIVSHLDNIGTKRNMNIDNNIYLNNVSLKLERLLELKNDLRFRRVVDVDLFKKHDEELTNLLYVPRLLPALDFAIQTQEAILREGELKS